MHITNNYGESVRVEVFNCDILTTDNITVNNNDAQTLEIIKDVEGIAYTRDLEVSVYKIGEDTPKDQKTIQLASKVGENEVVNVIITKVNTSPVILV
jgi:hypothetical protein